MRKKPRKSRPVVDEFGIDWGAELRYIEEHPNDPAIVTAKEIVAGIMQKHGLVSFWHDQQGDEMQPTICIDFDGVIHSYEKGWQDGLIYGDITPGFLEWAAEAQKHFKLVIYSSRSSTERGREAMSGWLADRMDECGWKGEKIEVTMAAEKPPAWLTIDDRCVRFDGSWDNPQLTLDAMRSFKPWNVRA